jgi:hypothetical protein
MPVSTPWGKDWVATRVNELNEFSHIFNMVDIGAGVGTYGKLLRPLFGGWVDFEAIEVWEPYVEEYKLEEIYNSVWVADVVKERDVWPIGTDLLIFGDVVEHLPKADAKRILRDRLGNVPRSVQQLTLVAIPIVYVPQGAVNGNPYEAHLPENHWDEEEMASFLLSMAAPADERIHAPIAVDVLSGDVVSYFLVRQGIWAAEGVDPDVIEDGAYSGRVSVRRP